MNTNNDKLYRVVYFSQWGWVPVLSTRKPHDVTGKYSLKTARYIVADFRTRGITAKIEFSENKS